MAVTRTCTVHWDWTEGRTAIAWGLLPLVPMLGRSMDGSWVHSTAAGN